MPTVLPTRQTKPLTAIGMADDEILRAVNRYHLITADQVCRLLYKPSVISYVRGRLSHLADGGFLLRTDLLRATRAGSGPIVYSLGPKGRRYLLSLRDEVPDRLRKYVAAEYGYFHLKHALSVTDVLIATDLVARAEPRLRVHTMLNEHALKRRAVKVELPSGKTNLVCPDAWLDIRVQRGGWFQTCVALELDRGTEHQPAWRQKVQSLLAWTKGPYRQVFGTESLTIAVITTAGEERQRSLIKWTETELTEQNALGAADLFRVAAGEPSTVPPQRLFYEPIWSSPFRPEPIALLSLAQASG